MQEKSAERPDQKGKAGQDAGDPAHQGQKPGDGAGKPQVAPKEAPEGGVTGRREFGRDG
jgi:hypothetical protein